MTTSIEVDGAIQRVQKSFGSGAIQRLDDDITPHPHLPTGVGSVDAALGIGGVPKGRVVEIFGPPGGGKTTLALHLIARAQADGVVVALIDTCHELVPQRAVNAGVDMGALLVSQPDSGEQALEIAHTLVRSGAVGLVVVDDSDGLTPRAVIEGDLGDTHVGLQSRLMSQAMRTLTASARRSEATVVFISSSRPKIGVTFGAPEVSFGTQALKFYSSVRISVRRQGAIEDGNIVVGQRVDIRVVKNKLAPPFRCAAPVVVFGHGLIDNCSCQTPENLSTSDGWDVATCLACGGVAR